MLCCAVLCCAVLALGLIGFWPKLLHCIKKAWTAMLLSKIEPLILFLRLCDATMSLLAIVPMRSSVCHTRTLLLF